MRLIASVPSDADTFSPAPAGGGGREANEQGEPVATILVVDDDKLVLELVRFRLAHDGYGVLATDDGRDAVELAKRHAPDLAIVDLVMPGMSGWEVIQELHDNPATEDIPVIILSGRTENEDVKRGLSLGAGDYVKKPFSPRELSERVESMLATTNAGAPARASEPAASPAPQELSYEQLSDLNDRLVHVTGELEAALAHRRLLLAQLTAAQEKERQRIAQWIHDDSLQVILAAELQLQTLANELDGERQVERIHETRRAVLAAGKRLRGLLFDLESRDLDEDGLAAGIQADLAYRRNEGWNAVFRVRDTTDGAMPPGLRSLLYRLAQELLANVRKHSRAANVDVEVGQRGGGFFVRVSDDGIGCSPKEALLARPGHLGLPEVRDRAEAAGGMLKVESRPGAGTIAEVWAPDTLTVGTAVSEEPL